MSKLLIAEFLDIAGNKQVPQMPPVAQHAVTFTSTAAQSNIFSASARYVRLVADADCLIEVGADPAANVSTTTVKLFANIPDYQGVSPGHRLSVVAAA